MRVRWVCALAVLGCGAAAPSPSHISIANQLNVFIEGDKSDELPFNPRQARLVAATNQLHVLVGHAMAFQFDAAVAPNWRPGFEELLVRDIETVIADLVSLRDREPRVFLREAPLLERIEFRYAVGGEDRFVASTHTFAATSNEPWQLGHGSLARALRRDYQETLLERLGNAEPETVAAADRADYVEVLTGLHHRPHPDLDLISKLMRLEPLVKGDVALTTKIKKELFDVADEFSRLYARGPAPSGPVAKAYDVWLGAQTQSATTTDDELLRVKSAVYASGRDGFPGFDRFGFGMSVFDAWAKAGWPIDSAAPRSRLFGAIVCPSTRLKENGGRSWLGRCEHEFYEDIFRDAAKLKRFAEALLARGDPHMVEAAAVATIYTPSAGDKLTFALGFAQLLESNARLWRVVWTTLADDLFEVGGAPHVTDEARRLWRTFPDRRGTVLYGLVQTDRYEHGEVAWEHFASLFGAPVTDTDFTQYLESGVRAVALLRVAWPALAKFPRATLLEPWLTRYVESPKAREYNFMDPHAALRGISQRLCDEHAVGDLAQLVMFFKARIATHPGENFGDALEDPASCRAALAVAAGPRRHYVSLSTGPTSTTSGHSTVVPLPPSKP